MQRKQRKWKWSEKRKSSFLYLQLTQKCRILNTQYRYVDAYRSIAFGQDTSDLRSQIKEAGMNAQSGALDLVPGDPNDEMYLRQAEHLMKRGALQAAIIYLHQSLTMNPESKVRDRYCLASGQHLSSTGVLASDTIFVVPLFAACHDKLSQVLPTDGRLEVRRNGSGSRFSGR